MSTFCTASDKHHTYVLKEKGMQNSGLSISQKFLAISNTLAPSITQKRKKEGLLTLEIGVL
jgi:hypothetical protein